MAVYSSEVWNVSEGQVITGDDEFLSGKDVGGNDTLVGDSGASAGYIAFGDAFEMDGKSVGGDDLFTAGDNVGDTGSVPPVPLDVSTQADFFFGNGANFAGDADTMYDWSRGGDDTMVGGANSNNVFFGDAMTAAYGGAHGGNDSLIGGNAGDGYATNALVGDSYLMADGSTGGSDELYGGHAGVAVAINDVSASVVPSVPGGDAYAINVMSGDAMTLTDRSHGGDDVMFGGDSLGGVPQVFTTSVVDSFGTLSLNLMAGDSFGTEGRVGFGDDHMTGGNGLSGDGYALNLMFGDVGDPQALFSLTPAPLSAPDAFNSSGKPAALNYGDDVLTGGDGFAINLLVGDAYELSSRGRGGDDVLHAGNGGSLNMLVGDAITMDGGARGGNDTLISGDSQDTMYGDSMNGGGRGGADKFVFAPGNGQDIVEDFHVHERDKLDLSAYNDSDFRDFRSLMASGRIQTSGDDVLIDLTVVSERSVSTQGIPVEPPVDSVLLVGVSLAELTSGSFIF